MSAGLPVNPYTCGRGDHQHCNGFSGDYDTYLCGCYCHWKADES